jgi:hypothetical protein
MGFFSATNFRSFAPIKYIGPQDDSAHTFVCELHNASVGR